MGKNRMAFAAQASIKPPVSGAAGRKPRIKSERLFDGSSEIVIVHRDEEYSLRITKNGKLILTK
jgi:hemin uptake protein HemP